jgi:hypothetical protein
MTLKYRILTVLVAGTFVAGFGLAESAYAAKKKKLTYEQAWDVCKKEMDKMGFLEPAPRPTNAIHAAPAA